MTKSDREGGRTVVSKKLDFIGLSEQSGSPFFVWALAC